MFRNFIYKIAGNHDNLNLYVNILGTFVIKGLSMLLTLSMMPMYIVYFENNILLGVWFSISSVLNWIFLLDFGIGNGLRNKLVPAFYEKNYTRINDLIISSYFFFFVISMCLGIIGFCVIFFSDVNYFFNVDENIINSHTLKKSLGIVYLGIIAQFFLSIVNSIYYAMERNVIASFTMLCSSIIVFTFISLSNLGTLEAKLTLISCVQAFALVVPLIVSNIVIFSKKLNYVKFKVKNINWKVKDEILGLGSQFFLIQISLMFINSTNEILISNLVSPEFTVTYQVHSRIFFIIVTAESLLIQPMWSAFSRAYVSKKYMWLKSTYRKFLYVGILSSLFSFVVAYGFKWIVMLWIGSDVVNLEMYDAILFACLVSEIIFINISTCVANSFSRLRCQLYCLVLGAFIKIPCSLFFVNMYNDWSAVVLANIVSLAPLLLFQSYFSHKMINDLVQND